MDILLKQIKDALSNKIYYLALFVSLSLPDICGALGSIDGNASGQNYINWFNKYVQDKYKSSFKDNPYFLTGSDCYYLRCSFLHQGSTQHNKSNYSRIVFSEPHPCSWHSNISDNVLQLDLITFCQDIINSVKQWFIDTNNDSVVN